MKKIFSLSFLVALVAILASSFATPAVLPSTSPVKVDTAIIPRWGTGANNDNTGRVLTWRYLLATDAAGADTVKLAPRAFSTTIQYSAVDSLAFSLSSLTQCYIGDELQVLITNSSGSGHLVKFVGTGWQFGSSGASITLTASKRANIAFVYDGIYWVEQSRLVQ